MEIKSILPYVACSFIYLFIYRYLFIFLSIKFLISLVNKIFVTLDIDVLLLLMSCSQHLVKINISYNNLFIINQLKHFFPPSQIENLNRLATQAPCSLPVLSSWDREASNFTTIIIPVTRKKVCGINLSVRPSIFEL